MYTGIPEFFLKFFLRPACTSDESTFFKICLFLLLLLIFKNFRELNYFTQIRMEEKADGIKTGYQGVN